MNKTTEKRREKILNYINTCRTDPLHFVHEGKVVKEILHDSLITLIRGVLRHSENCCSINSSEILETRSGRRRSSLDIWRHVKYFIPDVDIFTVMETLYVMRGELYGNYCWLVKRGVFTMDSYRSGVNNFLSREYMITFNAWKCLH